MWFSLLFACATEAAPTPAAAPAKASVPSVAAPKASNTSAPSSVEGVAEQVSASGLKFYILKEGSGESPAQGQTVAVHYTGWLADGTKFDSSVDKGRPLVFPAGVGKVIRGWDESVLAMKLGEKRQIRVPPELGYGERGAGGVIPPGATLTFDMELMELR
jgi:FKBP-type peptidyl-prolyl cis-trans isomerase